MLETRDLVKIYKPKRGVPVRALDGISLKFPETGMVFLLGKSGSGKSTLLNVLGGLDRYNSGEILMMGQSSKTFKQKHFDSYRNTYVGFIFQEYNVLDEFSVGTNIGLALQLQGIRPTDEQINTILKEVDLEGYGNRKPNELSGGQKQRVAIARALVKSPKIIMADEPTGALDSVTGRQILTTLKKLSKDKLVIVVSHDREFAEQYGDRIVELADGKVIRDVQRQNSELPPEAQGPVFEGDSLSLRQGYHLTEEDRQAICDYIQRMVETGKQPKIEVGEAGHGGFQPTDQTKIAPSFGGYHLIKSKLPMKYAFKMGASGLKHKKFRLVMTILLSCVAFVLFGLTDTMAAYDYIDTCTSSLADPESQISYVAFEKLQGETYEDLGEYTFWSNANMTDADYALIREKTGLVLHPVYTAAGEWENGITLDMEFAANVALGDSYMTPGDYMKGYLYYRTAFSGYVEVTQTLLDDLGATMIAGELPKAGTNELAISSFVLETFQKYGYTANGVDKTDIHTPADMLGKTLMLGGMEYTICGVIDPGVDYSRYASLKEGLDENAEFSDQLMQIVISTELDYALNYSISGLAVVSEGQIQRIYEKALENRRLSDLCYFGGEEYWQSYEQYGTISQIESGDVVWLDGRERTELASNELILSENEYMTWYYESEKQDPNFDFTSILGSETPDYSAIRSLRISLMVYNQDREIEMKLVGIIPNESEQAYSHIISDGLMASISASDGPVITQSLAAMPESKAAIRKIVEFSNGEWTNDSGELLCYELMNPVSFELQNLDVIFLVLQSVFMVVGIIFVIFASLLFSNFIATSISYKKREIGILRAIGSRSNDVFRIFFAESFIIAMINYVLSLTGTVVICGVINHFVRNKAGLLLTVLNVGFRQVSLLFAICLVVALIASFLPVRRIAAKRPIDAIRDR